jgi:hypothetical protein
MSLDWHKANNARALAFRDLRITEGRKATDAEAWTETMALLATGRLTTFACSTYARSMGWNRGYLTRRLEEWSADIDPQLADKVPSWWRTADETGLSSERTAQIPTSTASSEDDVQQTYSRRTADVPRARSSCKKKKEKNNNGQDTDASARAPSSLSAGLVDILKAEGLSSLDKVAKLTSKQILALPGVGPSALVQIERALGGHGLSLTPEPEKPKRDISKAQAVTDIWTEEFGEDYPWVDYYRRESQTADKIHAAARGDLDKVRAGFRAYITKARNGDAFPPGPPTLDGFLVKAPSWLQASTPDKPGPARPSGDAIFAHLVTLAGQVGRSRNPRASEIHQDQATAERVWQALGGAGGWQALCASNDYDRGQMRRAFVQAWGVAP